MNYRIEAIDILLNEDCILRRYYPLIPYKKILIKNIGAAGCRSKNECLSLSDDALLESGLPDYELVDLFRRFLVLYDVGDGKFKDIASLGANQAEAAAFRELYLLPGVKSVRAGLYYNSGYKGLKEIASALPEQIIKNTSEFIIRNGLDLKAPLPKEVRTHIAVAKVLTEFAVKE